MTSARNDLTVDLLRDFEVANPERLQDLAQSIRVSRDAHHARPWICTCASVVASGSQDGCATAKPADCAAASTESTSTGVPGS
jgi:hypothetical protein